ncbi:MAG: hypothetical protein JXR40_06905 [Pontiellaceae bacterium]|nr:hypothetical protein [Pontiellaceae bacterium]
MNDRLCIEFGPVRIVRLDSRNLGVETRCAGSWKPTGKYYARLSSAVRAGIEAVGNCGAADGSQFKLSYLLRNITALEQRVKELPSLSGAPYYSYQEYAIKRQDVLNLLLSGPLCSRCYHGSWNSAAAALLECVLTGPFLDTEKMLNEGNACVDALERFAATKAK